MAKVAKILRKDDAAKNTDTSLRANFGLPDWLVGTFLRPNGVGRRVMAFLCLVSTPILKANFFIVRQLPWRLKNIVVLASWKLWLGLNRRLPACIAQRGISDKLSIEGHALHNILWFARLFPMPTWMIRFSLSQLSLYYPPKEARTEWVESVHTPGLRSAYLHMSPKSETKPRVLCWVFGGAFISGDVEGNMGLAEHYCRLLGCDAFVIDMRLCPEHTIQDAVLDLYRGYECLLQRFSPENVVMLGVSSGGGAIVRMLQLAGSNEETRKEYFGERCPLPPPLPQPAGAVLLGAFVDYTQVTDSMQSNITFDWVVSPSVLEAVLEKQDILCGGPDKRRICSPLYQPMEGLCPLLLSVSEHECLIDEDKALAAKAKEAGVDVVLSTQPFMCHVFQLFSRFLPEAAREEATICDWVRARGGAWA